MSTTAAAATVSALLLAAHAAVNARLLRRPPTVLGSRGSVSVLIPARDEAARIGGCLEALLQSTGVDLEIIVYDDGSTDATAAVVGAIAARDPRLRLQQGTALPAGWLGKNHACHRLAQAASYELLVFVDADVRVAPDGLARAVALLDDAEVDLLSPYPRQIAMSLSERLLQPLLQWSWLTFLPLRLAERSAAPRLTAANGQLLVCRGAAYRRAGGHAAVREAVIEDVALARALKRAGARVAMADGTDIATCRMYRGWSEVRDGYSKSLWAATARPRGAVAMALLLGWLYCLPPAVLVARLVRGRGDVFTPAVGYGAGVAGRAIAARRTGGRPLDSFGHPVGIAVLIGLLLRSHALRARGSLTWKGRSVA